MCTKTTHFAVGIIISVWTVVQTSFHVLWTLSGHYLYECKIKPSHYLLVVLYLTYFYKSECGDIHLDDDEVFSYKTWNKSVPNISEITNETSVYEIIQLILEKAQLPKEATHALRTDIYMIIFTLLDGVWVLTAFLLFGGTCFQVKRSVSVYCYCPWLVVTGCVILLDVVASVHFGLDFLKVKQSYTSWLRFVGVQNYKDFSDLDDHPSAKYIPIESTTILVTTFSRSIILWIVNIINFSHILNIAVLAYQDNINRETAEEARRRRRKEADTALNLNTSESRIRSWQLFYGAIETTSIGSSASLKSMERDHNSNNSRRKKTSFRMTTTDSEANLASFEQRINSTLRSNSDDALESANTHYMRFSDVADVLETGPRRNVRKSSVESLKGQLPWSYIVSSSSIGENKGTEDRTFHLSDSVTRQKRRSLYPDNGNDIHNSKRN